MVVRSKRLKYSIRSAVAKHSLQTQESYKGTRRSEWVLKRRNPTVSRMHPSFDSKATNSRFAVEETAHQNTGDENFDRISTYSA
eukprot:190501-Amphidinium_carterae.1